MTEIANVIHENIRSLDIIHLGENLISSGKTYKQYLRESGVSFNFFDEKDVRFHKLQRSLDARMKQLTHEVKGCQKRQAEPIKPAEEDLLWTTGQLGNSTSQSMINTVFFYNTKHWITSNGRKPRISM